MKYKIDICSPKVRFPEFKNSETWKKKKLIDTIKKIIDFRGRTPKKLGMNWSTTGYLALSALNVKNGYIDYSKDKYYGNDDLYNKWMNGNDLYKGQVIFTTEAPMGNIVQIPDNNKYILSQRVIAFCVKNDAITDSFLALSLKSPFVFSQLISLSSGGTAQGISQKSLSSVTIYLPSNLIEQQKISDCLSSLDELIEAHEQKLDVLRQHKKGLMQRLFPAEGETTSRWRFPEFRNDAKWKENIISDICSVSTGKSNTQDKVNDGPYPFYVRSATIERSTKYLYDEEAVITVGDGVGTGKIYHYINGKYDLHQRCYRLFNFKNILGKFLFYFFSIHFYKRFSKMTAKNSVDSIRLNMITEMPIFVPSLPEQQKIADCLTSLDERIEAQGEKIATLKEHKKGLMQQLFPSL